MNKHEVKLIFGSLREELRQVVEIKSLDESSVGKDLERAKYAFEAGDFALANKFKNAAEKEKHRINIVNKLNNSKAAVNNDIANGGLTNRYNGGI